MTKKGCLIKTAFFETKEGWKTGILKIIRLNTLQHRNILRNLKLPSKKL